MSIVLEAAQIDAELHRILDLGKGEGPAVKAVTHEMMRLRDMNPKVFQAALLLTVSSFLVVGDRPLHTSARELQDKLEQLQKVQQKLEVLLKQQEDELLSRFSIDEEEGKLPKVKVN